MASFFFQDSLKKLISNQLNFGGATFYAHLTTAEPTQSWETINDMNSLIPTGGNYSYKQLSNPDNDSSKRVVDDGSIVTVSFANPLWPSLTTSDNASLTGLVIVNGISTSSFLVCYLERVVNDVATPFVPDGGPLEWDLYSGPIKFDYSVI